MKYIIIILTSLVLFSCKKDKIEPTPIVVDEYPNDIYTDKKIYAPGEMSDGFIQAKKNGLDWKASADAIIFNEAGKDLLHVAAYTFDKYEVTVEAFSFRGMSLTPQRYSPYTDATTTIYPKLINTSFSRWAGDSCIVFGLPHMIVDMAAKTNYIDVIKVDTVARIMEARFDVSLTSRPESKKIEKMRFSEGYMRLKIKRF